jgi:hypothetical protein
MQHFTRLDVISVCECIGPWLDGQVTIAAQGAQETLRYYINQDACARLPTPNGACVSLCSLSPALVRARSDTFFGLAGRLARRWVLS